MVKKGQAEILGIAIVIVLIILGFLFLLRFSTSGEADKLKIRLGRAQIANNVLSAMLKTSDTKCDEIKKPKIEELLIDCAENRNNLGSIVCTKTTKLSCAHLQDTLKEIFGNSIGKWGMDYEFTIKMEKKDVITPFSSRNTNPTRFCKLEADSQTYLLPTAIGSMVEITLKICSK